MQYQQDVQFIYLTSESDKKIKRKIFMCTGTLINPENFVRIA